MGLSCNVMKMLWQQQRGEVKTGFRRQLSLHSGDQQEGLEGGKWWLSAHPWDIDISLATGGWTWWQPWALLKACHSPGCWLCHGEEIKSGEVAALKAGIFASGLLNICVKVKNQAGHASVISHQNWYYLTQTHAKNMIQAVEGCLRGNLINLETAVI